VEDRRRESLSRHRGCSQVCVLLEGHELQGSYACQRRAGEGGFLGMHGMLPWHATEPWTGKLGRGGGAGSMSQAVLHAALLSPLPFFLTLSSFLCLLVPACSCPPEPRHAQRPLGSVASAPVQVCSARQAGRRRCARQEVARCEREVRVTKDKMPYATRL